MLDGMTAMFDEVDAICGLTSCGVTMFFCYFCFCFVVVVGMFHCKAPSEV